MGRGAKNLFLSGNLVIGENFLRNHMIKIQNVFAGYDKLKKSDGYSNQAGVSKSSITNSSYLSEKFLKSLKKFLDIMMLQGLIFYAEL